MRKVRDEWRVGVNGGRKLGEDAQGGRKELIGEVRKGEVGMYGRRGKKWKSKGNGRWADSERKKERTKERGLENARR